MEKADDPGLVDHEAGSKSFLSKPEETQGKAVPAGFATRVHAGNDR